MNKFAHRSISFAAVECTALDVLLDYSSTAIMMLEALITA
jgi:hypothetical protein